jgi:hypothetical protein
MVSVRKIGKEVIMLKSNTIQQLLEVFAIFYNSHSKGNPINRSYHEAVRRVAQKYGVTYQTIGDGCRRRLKLNDVSQLYSLLQRWIEGDPNDLIAVLKGNTDSHNYEGIDRFFRIPPAVSNHSEKYGPVQTNAIRTETFSFQLPEKDARILRATSEISGISVPEMLNQIVSTSIRDKIKELAREIIQDSQSQ